MAVGRMGWVGTVVIAVATQASVALWKKRRHRLFVPLRPGEVGAVRTEGRGLGSQVAFALHVEQDREGRVTDERLSPRLRARSPVVKKWRRHTDIHAGQRG